VVSLQGSLSLKDLLELLSAGFDAKDARRQAHWRNFRRISFIAIVGPRSLHYRTK